MFLMGWRREPAAVQTAKQMLRKANIERRGLSDLLIKYRCTTIPHIAAVPCQLLMSRLIRIQFPIIETKLLTGVNEKQKAYKDKYKNYYDKTG